MRLQPPLLALASRTNRALCNCLRAPARAAPPPLRAPTIGPPRVFARDWTLQVGTGRPQPQQASRILLAKLHANHEYHGCLAPMRVARRAQTVATACRTMQVLYAPSVRRRSVRRDAAAESVVGQAAKRTSVAKDKRGGRPTEPQSKPFFWAALQPMLA